MSRGTLKTQLEGSKHFGDYLEQEPYVRELLNAYTSSNFKTVLELLTRYSVRNLIHCNSIYAKINPVDKAFSRRAPVNPRQTAYEYDT